MQETDAFRSSLAGPLMTSGPRRSASPSKRQPYVLVEKGPAPIGRPLHPVFERELGRRGGGKLHRELDEGRGRDCGLGEPGG